MSEFWVASDPPGMGDITAWCEREVETACTDLVKHLKVDSHFLDEGGGEDFKVYPFADSPWDMVAEGQARTIADLIADAADSHVCWAFTAEKRGIYGDMARRMDQALGRIELAIKEVRALLRPDEEA